MVKLVSGFLTAALSDVPSVTAPPGGPGSTATKTTLTSAAWVTGRPYVTRVCGQSTQARSAAQRMTATTSARGAPPARRRCLTRVGWRGAPQPGATTERSTGPPPTPSRGTGPASVCPRGCQVDWMAL